MAETVDARGLSCPQPVIMTKNAINKTKGGEITVIVDTMTQVQNCSRIAEKLGWSATWEEKEGEYHVHLRK
jgi:TusA-related sulfurtransferase